MQRVSLNSGHEIPIVGFGTWHLYGPSAYKSVASALKAGYRHIDTARIYKNEKQVGKAIADSGIPRNEIFVTTKLWNSDHGDVAKALETSLDKLGLVYVDLYLIHWPMKERIESWQTMAELHKAGKIKSIGVSNFTVKHLEDLLSSTDVVPAVNQVEFSPFLYQRELHAYCREKGIAIEAYSPLTHAHKLSEPKLMKIAEKYGKSSAQLMLRWATQKDIIVLPKSKNEGRLKQNIDIFDFEIDKSDMSEMDSWNEDARYCWDPNEID